MTDEKRQLLLTPASSIRSARQRWLWEGIIPLGTVALFAGRGGEGKSSFALHLAAQLNAGLLEGDFHGDASPVLIASLEDDWSTIMKPRLIAAGADLDQTFKLGIASTLDEITRETIPSLPLDVDLIKQAIVETGARMIILDPATSLMAGDMNKREDVRHSLDGLLAIAQETASTIVLIVHFSKGNGNVSEKISGSHALRDAARSVLLFATDEESGNRVVSMDKANYSANATDSFAFQLLDTVVRTDDDEITHVARVNYLGASDVTVSDIVNRSANDGMETDRSEAERWLVSYLEDHDGEAAARDILKAARGDGLETQTVQRASRKVTSKAKSGFQGQWIWTLDLTKEVTKKSKASGVQMPDAFDTFEENVTPLHPEIVPIRVDTPDVARNVDQPETAVAADGDRADDPSYCHGCGGPLPCQKARPACIEYRETLALS
ncbi:MAG TPA: AAA family ATPase [Microbacteriaceae bacterium]